MKKRVLLAVVAGLIGVGVWGQQPKGVASGAVRIDTRSLKAEAAVCLYSLRKYTAFEAIEKAKECGAEVVELFFWQKLSPEHPEVVLNQHLAPEHRQALSAKLEAVGVRAVNAYVADFGKSEVETRKLFMFAKEIGLRGLTGEPAPQMLDRIEGLVKESGVAFCFHNHARDTNKPEYRNWDPEYLMGLMEGRDKRMGFSVDTGHIYRSAMDPVDYLKKVEGRVLSVHLKDIRESKYGSPDVVYGKGVGDIAAVLAELRRQRFSGHIGVEFDHATERVESDVRECLEVIKAGRR